MVHLFDPADMREMFQQIGQYPYRRSHRALLRYRSKRPDTYRSGGIFPENGPEWARLRSQFRRPLLLAKNINAYDRVMDQVSLDLVRYIRSITRCKDKLIVHDFGDDLYRWALESICAIMLDSRIGCLDTIPKSSSSGPSNNHNNQPDQLIWAAHQTNEAVMETEQYNSWETDDQKNGDYLRLEQAQDVMAEICGGLFAERIEQVESKANEIKEVESNQPTLLTQFILDPSIDRKDLFGIILDCVLAGIDTTSITTGFALYYLAKHPHYQQRLFEEIQAVTNYGTGVDINRSEIRGN